MVCVTYNNNEPNDNCTSPLFVPEQLQTETDVTGRITCRSQSGKSTIVTWKFMGEEGRSERYNFNTTVPVDDNMTSVTVQSIVYDGTEQVVFKDKLVKVYITPEK
jgi:hypothetical protein